MSWNWNSSTQIEKNIASMGDGCEMSTTVPRLENRAE